MSAVSLAAIIAAAVSAGLAGLAIALAIVFYRMSVQLAESMRRSEQGIAASVCRLEKLFDTLYRDSHALYRQTVEDLRDGNHRSGQPPRTPVDATAALQLEDVKQEIIAGVTAALTRPPQAHSEHLGAADDVAVLIDQAINRSRQPG